jgi:hypothetical protein
MTQNIPFPNAAAIIWEWIQPIINFNLVTSENWINNDDIISSEFEAVLEEIDEED